MFAVQREVLVEQGPSNADVHFWHYCHAEAQIAVKTNIQYFQYQTSHPIERERLKGHRSVEHVHVSQKMF